MLIFLSLSMVELQAPAMYYMYDPHSQMYGAVPAGYAYNGVYYQSGELPDGTPVYDANGYMQYPQAEAMPESTDLSAPEEEEEVSEEPKKSGKKKKSKDKSKRKHRRSASCIFVPLLPFRQLSS